MSSARARATASAAWAAVALLAPRGAAAAPDSHHESYSLSAGYRATCALSLADGELRCWGGEAPSENAMMYDEDYLGALVDVPGNVSAWSSVSAGDAHTCGVARDDGAMHCWGRDVDSQMDVPSNVSAWSSVSAGATHTCGIARADGALHCWGLSYAGQTAVPSDVTAWSSASLGYDHTCGIAQADSALHCWGSNSY